MALSQERNSRQKSTAIQAAIGALLSAPFAELIDQVGVDVGGRGQVYIALVFAWLTSVLMAYLDEQGVGYPGKKALGRDGE